MPSGLCVLRSWDTALVFPGRIYKRESYECEQWKQGLKDLLKKRLQMTIQNDASGHGSIVDSQAAMNLMRFIWDAFAANDVLHQMNDGLSAYKTYSQLQKSDCKSDPCSQCALQVHNSPVSAPIMLVESISSE